MVLLRTLVYRSACNTTTTCALTGSIALRGALSFLFLHGLGVFSYDTSGVYKLNILLQGIPGMVVYRDRTFRLCFFLPYLAIPRVYCEHVGTTAAVAHHVEADGGTDSTGQPDTKIYLHDRVEESAVGRSTPIIPSL